ncbi:hypothetical protein [Sulfuriroseicoccus oceanibius]|uniref:Type II secretion system protein GspG C-terminal domain-containing protein n=1 Tax=Sulfuriroseicoccus oceanibius TaxID=2707525 RepID=A0A6B3L4K6_9BACT|nr:hypothetical protein [Sulfuriroseicoccus oceanibius]QQL45648.1 hypothetical protein G3M56_003395 [Sulfuriroseicoccus oceanibius]
MSKGNTNRRILLFGVLPAVGCLALSLLLWWGLTAKDREWERLKAEWEAKGESFDPKDFVTEIDCEAEDNGWFHPLVVDARSGGNYVTEKVGEIDGYLWSMGIERPSEGGLTLREWGDPEKPLGKTQHEMARDYLARFSLYQSEFDELEGLADRPFWQSGEVPSVENEWGISESYGVGEVFTNRATLRLLAGEPDAAWEDVMRARNVLRWYEQNPVSLFSLLVWGVNDGRISNAVLDGCLMGAWSDAQLRSLAGGELTAGGMGYREMYLASARGEVAFQVDGLPDWLESPEVPSPYRLLEAHYGIYIIEAQLAPLVAYEAMGPGVSLMELADAYESAHARATAGRLWQGLKRWTELGKAMVASSSADFVYRLLELDVRRGCVPVVAAAELYRREHGSWPSTLKDLVPEYLPVIPKDPVDGAAMRYVVGADGVPVVYSVGRNRKDDGGADGDWCVRLTW